MLTAFGAFWLLLAIRPRNRKDWALENILSVALLCLLVATYRKYPLSHRSYLSIFCFLLLHTIGAHYTYEEVPVGHWLKNRLRLGRNHYDRVVHFAFGVFMSSPMYDVAVRFFGVSARKGRLAGWAMVTSASIIFECVELATAYVVRPELGEAYLGTQGDEFDGYKDMVLASIGAGLSMAISDVRLSR